MENISSDRGDGFRNGFHAGDIINQLSRLLITLGSDLIGISFLEGYDCAKEVFNVLFGPISFDSNAS